MAARVGEGFLDDAKYRGIDLRGKPGAGLRNIETHVHSASLRKTLDENAQGGQQAKRIYRLALRITRNTEDAKDVQQQTMWKAYRNKEQFEGRSPFTTWISRIAINEALMCLRRRRSAAYLPLEEAIPPGGKIPLRDEFYSSVEEPEPAYARKELRNLLMRAIESLRPLHRSIFLLRGVERLSTKETARALTISEGIVKARLRRARAELRTYLRHSLPRHMKSGSGKMTGVAGR